VPARCEKDVLGLDVSMDEAFVVRRRKTEGDVARDGDRLLERQRTLTERSRRVSPSSSSVTTYATAPSTPKSWIARMLGCDSAATAFASRSNRTRASGSAARCAGSTLTATSRLSLVSRARYTSPMPPAPMATEISYWPKRRPGVNDKGEAQV
jgi:hypothetical protein